MDYCTKFLFVFIIPIMFILMHFTNKIHIKFKTNFSFKRCRFLQFYANTKYYMNMFSSFLMCKIPMSCNVFYYLKYCKNNIDYIDS